MAIGPKKARKQRSDKGQGKIKGDPMFEDTRDLLDDQAKAETDHENEISEDYRSGDRSSYENWKQMVRMEERISLLDKFVPDRRCPECQEVKPNSKQWVIKRKSEAVCKSCHMRWGPGEETEADFQMNMFKPVERVKVNATALSLIREATGLGQSGFAAKCGWTRGYQARLENGYVATIDLDTAKVIVTVLEKFKITSLDGTLIDLLEQISLPL